LITGSNAKLIDDFKLNMMQAFKMTGLGLMIFFLGMEIKQHENEFFICKKNMQGRFKRNFKLEDCKQVNTPMNKKEKLSKDDGVDAVNETRYKSLTGCFMYLTKTRPDILYVVSVLSRFVHCPNKEHLKVTKRVVRKSTSGYCFSLGLGIFSWCSKKQETIVQSTAEAGFIVATVALNQVLWLKKIIIDLIEQNGSTKVFVDNQTAIIIFITLSFMGKPSILTLSCSS